MLSYNDQPNLTRKSRNNPFRQEFGLNNPFRSLLQPTENADFDEVHGDYEKAEERSVVPRSLAGFPRVPNAGTIPFQRNRSDQINKAMIANAQNVKIAHSQLYNVSGDQHIYHQAPAVLSPSPVRFQSQPPNLTTRTPSSTDNSHLLTLNSRPRPIQALNGVYTVE